MSDNDSRRDAILKGGLMSEPAPGECNPGQNVRGDCRDACVCGEINTRHCPVHGQGESTDADVQEVRFEHVEPREGIAMVYGPDGKYLGCIGIARWKRLVEKGHL